MGRKLPLSFTFHASSVLGFSVGKGAQQTALCLDPGNRSPESCLPRWAVPYHSLGLLQWEMMIMPTSLYYHENEGAYSVYDVAPAGSTMCYVSVLGSPRLFNHAIFFLSATSLLSSGVSQVLPSAFFLTVPTWWRDYFSHL